MRWVIALALVGFLHAADPTAPNQPVAAPGQQITIPGAVFPIYADFVPPHHLPASPQAISSSDVTFLRTSTQEPSLESVIQQENIHPISSTSSVNNQATTSTTAPPATAAAVIPQTLLKPDTLTQNHVAAIPAPISPSTPAVLTPTALTPSVETPKMEAKPAPARPTNLSLGQPVNPLLLQSHIPNFSGFGIPLLSQFPQVPQLVSPWTQLLFPPMFSQPQILAQVGGSSRPSAPEYHLHGGPRLAPMISPVEPIPMDGKFVPLGYPHMNVPPLVNPFKGTSFENMPFPFAPYGAPFLGTPMGLTGPLYLSGM